MSGPSELRAWDGSEQASYRLTVNGVAHDVSDAWVGESLLHVLRERLGYAGTKNACEQGECGSCSILLDDELVCSCLVMAAAACDTDIRTVDDGDDLDAVQRAFVSEGAVQCGFCTPGLIMAVRDLLDANPDPDELEVREAISGNLCRCTGYGRILAAIETAKHVRAEGR